MLEESKEGDELESSSKTVQKVSQKPTVTAPLPDEISGWLTKTQGGALTEKDEPFMTRFFRLDLNSGVLSEFQDNHKSRKLCEHLLLRKIVHIELNLSNKLREEHVDLF